MVKFLGGPLDIPAGTADNHAARKVYIDAIAAALGSRVTAIENSGGGGGTGPQGIQGIQGVPGTNGAAGMQFRGAWSSGTDYAANDAVSYTGSVYFTTGADTVGTPPTNDDGVSTNPGWVLFAAEGAPGAQGIQGIQGVAGTAGATGATGAAGSPASNLVTSVATRIGDVVLTKSDVALGNVDNTSDINKPVSTAQAAADTAASTADRARANHTGTQSADTLTDGTTNKAFLATERTKLTGVATGATANSADAVLLARANHTGTQSADTLTDGATNKAFLATERSKLAGVASAATANSTDAVLLARANHTGTQVAATVSDFSAAADARITAQKGVASGLAPLDASSKIASTYLPAIAITSTFTVASQVAQLALTVQEGDVAIRTDLSQTYIQNGGSAGTMADWTLLATPTQSVASVAGRTGVVVLSSTDVGLGNVTNTADTAKPVSTAQQTALNLKADLAGPALSGVPTAPTATAGTSTTQLATTAFAGTAATTAAAAVTKTTLGLGSVDNTADSAKPVSAATQTALNLKADLAGPTFTAVPAAPTATAGTSTTQLATTAFVSTADALKANLASPALTGVPTAPTAAPGTNTTQLATTAFVTGVAGVTSVAGRTGIVTLTSADVALGSVDNTSDVNKPVSTAQAAANTTDRARANHTGTQLAATVSDFSSAADARITAQKGAASGLAPLDSGSKIASTYLPAIAITSTFSVASQAAQLALTVQEGDVAIRTDVSQTYIQNGGSAGTMADWTLLATPTDAVTSVAGRTGVVTLAATDVGLGNVTNTSDANKPVSTAGQTALNLKADLVTPTFTGAPAAPTATAGTSTTQLATTAFVSAADALKADLSGPTFTGVPKAPTATVGTNTTQLATTAFVVAAANTGPTGPAGAAATVAVGTTSTGTAAVTNSGTTAAAVFNFTVPQGIAGTTGTAGAAATIAAGTATPLSAGSAPTVTNSGTSAAATFNFGIPAGATGATGSTGATGTAATVAVGTTNTGVAAVTNSGTSSAAVLNFTVPQGVTGAAATIAVGTVTPLSAGATPTIANAGTTAAAVFNFGIPAGATGATGPTGPTGPSQAIVYPVSTPTTTYTILSTDRVVIANSAAGFVATLPSAVTSGVGKVFSVKNINTGTVTMGSTAGTVDGGAASLVTIAQWAVRTFISDGANWFLM